MKDRVSIPKNLAQKAMNAEGMQKARPIYGPDVGRASVVKGDNGLKKAWSDQAERPSQLIDMDGAKKKVR